ncbi:MAG: 50S ribosomal protein L14e [Candidatus Aenigmarchaeota archaeon]|nr:50S ribosomal protein L14e [Candidatus Aenigmarchaeota archaeon]
MSEAKITETGRICVRLAGRFAGMKGEITKILDNNFVEVTYKLGENTKVKKTNIAHIVVLNEKASVEKAEKK